MAQFNDQVSFVAGEIAPALYGNVSLAKYKVAATTMRNGFVSYRGGYYSRAGTALCDRAKQAYGGSPPRLIRFQFSNDQGYALEFGDNYMRVFANGAPVVEPSLNITGVTRANPAVVTVAATGALSATANNGGVVLSYAPGNHITLAGGTYSVPAILGVTNTRLLSLGGNNPGTTGYAPADTIVLAGGTQTTAPVVTVSTTRVVSATVAAGGSGGTNGTQTVTGTTGTGTKFQASVTVAGNAVTAVLSITVGGSYTVNPSAPTVEPVTGAGLTGAQLNVKLGVNTFAITTAGIMTANPAGAAFTQASTSGSGTGATFNNAIFGPNAVSVVNAGVYTALPANPVLQASTTGFGLGATFNLSSASVSPYANGDWIVIASVGGMTQLNGNTYIVAGMSGSTFSLEDLNGNAIDSTGYGTYTGGGTVSRIFTLTTPWAAADLPLLKYTQSADVMTLVNPNYPPNDLARYTASSWTVTQTNFGATIAAPSGCSASATVQPDSGLSPPTLPAAYAYCVTAVSGTTGEESNASPIANVTNSVDIAATAGSIVVTWNTVAGAQTYNIYKAPTSYNTAPGDTANALPVPAGAIFDFVGESYGNQFVDSNITADGTQVPPVHDNPFAPRAILYVESTAGGSGYTTASLNVTTSTGSGLVAGPVIVSGVVVAWIVANAGSNYGPNDYATVSGDGSGCTVSLIVGPQTGTYPGCVAYFQQRRVYAGSLNQPDTFWMSHAGDFLNFDTSVPVTANDSITATPWAQQVNGVQFMIPMPGGLVVLTGLGAWQVGGAGSSATNPEPISPTSIQAIQQAFNGCNNIVAPLTINFDILYVQAKGSIVRDLSWNYWINIYTGSDLTQLSGQLFTGYQMMQSAWCEEPYKLAWFVRNDGAMLSLTYLKEQEVYGWARHDTYGQIVSCASVTEPPVDALYLIVARPCPAAAAGYAYYVERMDNRIWGTSEDPWCIDCGLAYAMPEPAATLTASSASGAVTFLATAPVFSSGSVGQVIRMGGGIATVTGYTGTTTLTGVWNLPPVSLLPNAPAPSVLPATSGNWSITAPVSTVLAPHLANLTVTGLADGVPIPPRVASSTGAVTLPQPSTNIKVGLPFLPQLQLPRLESGGQQTIQGRRKTVTAVTCRMEASSSISTGTNQPDGAAQSPPAIATTWSNLSQVVPEVTQKTYTTPGGGTVDVLYTGDMRIPVLPSWLRPGQIAFQQNYPVPMNVTDAVPEFLEGDTPEEQFAPQQQQQGERQGTRLPRPPGIWMLRE